MAICYIHPGDNVTHMKGGEKVDSAHGIDPTVDRLGLWSAGQFRLEVGVCRAEFGRELGNFTTDSPFPVNVNICGISVIVAI